MRVHYMLMSNFSPNAKSYTWSSGEGSLCTPQSYGLKVA